MKTKKPAQNPVPPPPSPAPPPRERGPKLSTLKNALDQFADIYRQLKLDKIPPKKANSLVFVLSGWVDAKVLSDTEKRLGAMEAAVARVREGNEQ